MKKIGLLIFSFFLIVNIQAEDSLDVLDKQSKEFFKAITGLEKDYLEEQISNIKDKEKQKNRAPKNLNNNIANNVVKLEEEKKISQEEYEKNIFNHENEMARLTSDFTRTKKLKDIKIKSMYSFNGKDYVVLETKEDDNDTAKEDEELSFNIEGRYTRGDSILTHRIVSLNTRTKTVQLYKKLDDEYGYYIYLSNYGISVSDLKKRPAKIVEEKTPAVKKVVKQNKSVEVKPTPIKKKFQQIANKQKVNVDECLYTVRVQNLNVRNQTKLNARILRILKINDQFTVQEKKGNWVHIDTIYKKKSGDVMIVTNDSNWLQIMDNNVVAEDKNCL